MSIMSGTAGGASTAEGPHAGLPGGRTMAARLSKLEQQVDTLAAAAADSEVRQFLVCILTVCKALNCSRQQHCHTLSSGLQTHAAAAQVGRASN